MQIINKRDIDFNKLNKLNWSKSTESTLYYDEELFYKMFADLFLAIRKKKKLMLLNDGNVISDVVIPNILINDGLITSGCAMERIKGARSLYKYKNSDIFMMLVYLVSLSLKKIHNDPRNIVVGDLHFNNIIVDNKGQHHFIDFDSCMIDGIAADRLPKNLKYYVFDRGNFKFEVGKDTDRFCLFLSTLGAIFGKDIDYISEKEYDEKSEMIYTLKNMRSFFLEVKKNNKGIPDIPYLSELISINDFPGVKKMKVKSY